MGAALRGQRIGAAGATWVAISFHPNKNYDHHEGALVRSVLRDSRESSIERAACAAFHGYPQACRRHDGPWSSTPGTDKSNLSDTSRAAIGLAQLASLERFTLAAPGGAARRYLVRLRARVRGCAFLPRAHAGHAL
jgi:dTDP-4-amino-4,6-dideoxygalactose transaminase